MKRSNYKLLLLGVIYLLFFLDGAAHYFSLYWTIPWFDRVTHCIGGMWVALFVPWFVQYSGYMRPRPWPLSRTMGITALSVAVVGIGWELYELSFRLWAQVPLDMPYYIDTAKDLSFDVVGGVLGFSVFALLHRNGFAPPAAVH